jgi:hypothetical protein
MEEKEARGKDLVEISLLNYAGIALLIHHLGKILSVLQKGKEPGCVTSHKFGGVSQNIESYFLCSIFHVLERNFTKKTNKKTF